jgi:hypothetical protein
MDEVPPPKAYFKRLFCGFIPASYWTDACMRAFRIDG